MESSNYFDVYTWYAEHLGESPNPEQNRDWVKCVDSFAKFKVAIAKLKGGARLLNLRSHWNFYEDLIICIGKALPHQHYRAVPRLRLACEDPGLFYYHVYIAQNSSGVLTSLVLSSAPLRGPALDMERRSKQFLANHERDLGLMNTPPAQVWAVEVILTAVCATDANPLWRPVLKTGTMSPSELHSLLKDIRTNHFSFDKRAGGLLFALHVMDHNPVFAEQVVFVKAQPLWRGSTLCVSCIFHVSLRASQVQTAKRLVEVVRYQLDNVLADHWGLQYHETSSGTYGFNLSEIKSVKAKLVRPPTRKR